MFEGITKFFKKFSKEANLESKDTAKERLHLVLMQDRANVSADFLELMKQEIIEVIKKYIDVDENAIDVKLTNKVNSDGTTGAPALYANIPIVSIKEEKKNITIKPEEKVEEEVKTEENKETEIPTVEESNEIESTIVKENTEIEIKQEEVIVEEKEDAETKKDEQEENKKQESVEAK